MKGQRQIDQERLIRDRIKRLMELGQTKESAERMLGLRPAKGS